MSSVTQFLMDNPGLHLAQGGLILFAVLVLFLLFFALRDILLRTRSFWYQFFCIVIVTVLPVVGFLLYLLIRPARTIKQRELEAMLLTIVAADAPGQIQVGEMEDVEEVESEEKEEREDKKEEEDDDEDKEEEEDAVGDDKNDDKDDDKAKDEHHHSHHSHDSHTRL